MDGHCSSLAGQLAHQGYNIEGLVPCPHDQAAAAITTKGAQNFAFLPVQHDTSTIPCGEDGHFVCKRPLVSALGSIYEGARKLKRLWSWCPLLRSFFKIIEDVHHHARIRDVAYIDHRMPLSKGLRWKRSLSARTTSPPGGERGGGGGGGG
eukprot:CAMPEP_0181168502 /NCGR_PEP_ID=MMETSP1096-20121128/308_1 /TAXON_ID=156174 ORGANISM="Chrysochromulina ericina, Strain CCMP281" /NCGR_SAMPLE_ID=MMETSP1096 /ASSEMBLY_ACC=CAM_ASM_000453 /LENGTH=150 /DNA_ID=CAMNT_0023255883 /DNA_START=480 /DNA_END=930 /DNA_ORIENTATION=-